MTAAFQPLIPAQPAFNQAGIARSLNYDDLYHSAAGAREQAEYVFLKGNGLPERWQAKPVFTICETGFGLGNNFLTTWLRWREDPRRCHTLHYVSFEAHPFSRDDLQRMLAHGPAEFKPLVSQLLTQWPELLPGIHRLSFEHEKLSLTLVFGDINQKAKLLNAKVNAFFLDGFAPRVNPDMWSRRLFGQLVRLSVKGATAASWCSAGQVRRDLQDAGFVVQKAPGFAGKREMIQAQLRPHLGRDVSLPVRSVTVLGAGIAGASTAAALARRGIAVHVLDPVLAHGQGASHKGHHALAMTPIMTSDDAPRARISRAGVLLAKHYWCQLAPNALHQNGTVVVATNAEEELAMQKAVTNMAFPTSWVQYRSAQQLSEQWQVPVLHGGLYYPQAMVAEPESLIAALLDHPLIQTRAVQVRALSPENQGWRLQFDDSSQQTEDIEFASCVVVCTSSAAPQLVQQAMPDLQAPRFLALQTMAGQVSFYDETRFQSSPTEVLAGDGYLLPSIEGLRVGGSTYEAATVPLAVTPTAHKEIQRTLDRWRVLTHDHAFNAVGGWVGQRAMTSDHLPVFADLQNGLWVNCAYGSTGFSWAALFAEELAARLANEPCLLERDLSQAAGLR